MKASLSLIASLVSALGATACCAVPLLFVSLGLGGAWTLRVQRLSAYQPVFATLTLIFVALAFHRLYVRPRACAVDGTCAQPEALRTQRIAFWVVVALIVAMAMFLE
jgi:mercuric ion transport protein